MLHPSTIPFGKPALRPNKKSQVNQSGSAKRIPKTYNRRDSQMVTHSSTSRPVQCLCMAERTGCPVLTDLWSYVPGKEIGGIYLLDNRATWSTTRDSAQPNAPQIQQTEESISRTPCDILSLGKKPAPTRSYNPALSSRTTRTQCFCEGSAGVPVSDASLPMTTHLS
jgi:hypothetical protein